VRPPAADGHRSLSAEPGAVEPPDRPGAFPLTRGSLLAAVGGGDEVTRQRAWDELLRSYWKPVHRYLRLRWRASNEEAEDWTQEFLARAVERGTFATFDPAQARFRTFLRVCLDRWVANRLEASSRLKRGGGERPLSLDASPLAERAAAADGDPEELFHREWLRGVLETALAALRASCATPEREVRWRLFARYDLGEGGEGGAEPDRGARPSYAELATEHALPVTQVTNHLAWARRELRRLVLDELGRHTTSEREQREEARRLFGVEPP
jgi:RNA polymerase sigma factor (sigma-70 family)